MKSDIRTDRIARCGDQQEIRRQAKAAQAAAVERLKASLLRRRSTTQGNGGERELLTRAATEAAALALTTKYPLLVLPELLMEKEWAVRGYLKRQAEVREKTQEWMSLAA
ncbi:MAG: hypothetical protein IPM17_15900 [Verrucomicrobia bacterium]|nr:hypothetical protein [Verrucomicrobiota bacterium]